MCCAALASAAGPIEPVEVEGLHSRRLALVVLLNVYSCRVFVSRLSSIYSRILVVCILVVYYM
eukprot:COSAG05_NODE_226_length_13453_cov_12.522315_3_plen_63_part_00